MTFYIEATTSLKFSGCFEKNHRMKLSKKLNVGWAEQSEAQQNQNVGLYYIQPNLPFTATSL